MKKYTLQQFNKEYSDDNACLDKLYKLRFTDLVCPKCNSEKEFTRVNDRIAWNQTFNGVVDLWNIVPARYIYANYYT